jgi:hypothetical protein
MSAAATASVVAARSVAAAEATSVTRVATEIRVESLALDSGF